MRIYRHLINALLIIGIASQYGFGVMQRTIHVRQTRAVDYPLPLDLPTVDGYVAVVDCTTIGSIVWIRPVGTPHWESFLVADCASTKRGSHHDGGSSRDWMLRNNILVEVDYATAKRWNTLGYGADIEMRLTNPYIRWIICE